MWTVLAWRRNRRVLWACKCAVSKCWNICRIYSSKLYNIKGIILVRSPDMWLVTVICMYIHVYIYNIRRKHVGFERQYIISRCHWRIIIDIIWYVWNIWLDFFRSTFKMFYAFEVSKKQHCFDCFAIWLSSAVLCECLSYMNEKQDYLFVLLIYLNVYKSYLIILYW